MIKYQIKDGQLELLFHINEKGNLVTEANGEVAEINHLTAVELIDILSRKLYEHQANNQSLIKRIFT
jgi:hypothetical protein